MVALEVLIPSANNFDLGVDLHFYQNKELSEEIIQKGYEEHGLKIGKYQFYNLGATTISTLKKYKIILNEDYKEYEKKKPDALLVDRRNKSKPSVIAIIEYKSPDEFKTKKQKKEAVEQGNNYSQVLKAKITIATDKSTFIWFNPNHKNSENEYVDDCSKINRSYSIVKQENDNDFTKSFNIDQQIDETEITKLNNTTKESIESLESILGILSKTNSKLQEVQIRDPTSLAKSVWQDVWSVTGKDPEKCLYTFVELLIFKYLSDLGILTKDEKGNRVDFQYIYSLEKKEAFRNYSANVRKHLKKMFKEGKDKTTIINGTILNPKVIEHSIVFHKILKKFNEFGEIKNIDPSFKSKVFEEFMKESISTKNWGRYFTPRNVIDAIIEMSDIEKLDKDSKICDPACGVGGFVLEPMKVKKNVDFYYNVKGNNVKSRYRFYGFDKGFEKDEQLTIILAKANMLIFLSELLKNNESIIDDFSDLLNNTFQLATDSIMGTLEKTDHDQYDLILTNPPYVNSGSSNYKDRIKSDENLKKFYKVNASGIEGLFLEWIINSLKPSKKAFVIVPQGVLERSKDKPLRDFISEECIIDGIIYLPSKTFYSTLKKTYILAITKKEGDTHEERKSVIQTDPIFSYIVKDIGETLDGNRLSKNENDLPNMVSLFNQFKGAKTTFDTDDDKCKIIPISSLTSNNYWSVENFWSDKEKKQLGIVDESEEMSIIEFKDNVKELSDYVITLESKLKNIHTIIELTKIKYKTVEKSITDLFSPLKGSAKYNKRYIHEHKGKYHVYSSQTSNQGIFGKINTFDYVDECLTWTMDGIYAGTVFHRSCPFSATSHCGVLFLRKEYKEKIDLKYICHILSNLPSHSIGEQNRRVTIEMLSEIRMEIPITNNGEYDLIKQNELTKHYDQIEELQQELRLIKNDLTNIINSKITLT